jgi:hypothetical protein
MEASQVLPLLATQKIQTMSAGLRPSPASSGATTTRVVRPDPKEAAARRRLSMASFGYRAEARRQAHRPLLFNRDPKDALILSLIRVG